MNSTAIQLILTVVEDVLPLVTKSETVGKIITFLEQVLPVVVAEATDLIAPIKNIIAALSANPATTADQLTALQALDAQADAAFDQAAADYTANHPST